MVHPVFNFWIYVKHTMSKHLHTECITACNALNSAVIIYLTDRCKHWTEHFKRRFKPNFSYHPMLSITFIHETSNYSSSGFSILHFLLKIKYIFSNFFLFNIFSWSCICKQTLYKPIHYLLDHCKMSANISKEIVQREIELTKLFYFKL